jgi:hypothetical protein
MMAAVFGFIAGAFVQLMTLLLVYAGAALGARMIGPASALELVGPFAFVALYAAFAIVPSRDLVQGWLGMIAGRQPERYDDRAQCLGRGVACLCTLLLLLLPLADKREPPDRRAMEAAFLLLATLGFGLGGAVPWLWFGLLGKGRGAADELPALLREAGTRGSRFCYCAFLGLGLGIVAGEAAISRRAGTWERYPQPEVVLPPRSPDELVTNLEPRDDEIGDLCATPTPDCPREHRSEVTFTKVGKVEVNVGTWGKNKPCSFAFDPGFPFTPGAQPAIHAFLIDPQPFGWSPPWVPVIAGDHVGVTATVPSGKTSCQYYIHIVQPLVAP